MNTENFIKQAKQIHGDKYNYSKVEYINPKTKVCIICPMHGEFWQFPYNHLKGKGCTKCKYDMLSKKLTKTINDFIEQAQQIHGNKYDYSKVKYIDSHTKVCIICKEHGEFWQTPSHHLHGNGCPICKTSILSLKKRKKVSEFIEQAKQIHGDKYDYSKVEYVNSSTKVCIICPIHGEFWQIPSNHLSGKGCLLCCGLNKKTNITFIEQAKQIHGDKYDYSKVEYVNTDTKVCIICKEHGEFWQTPHSHLSGANCPKCYNKVYDTKTFIEKSAIIHNNKYDYSKVKYIDSHTKVCIICKEHGEFWQTPNDHLRGKGCPNCNIWKMEEKIKTFLQENNINFFSQCKNDKLPFLNRQSVDFYLPNHNIVIECQGKQHFEPIQYYGGIKEFEKRQILDEKKYNVLKEHGIKVLYYSEIKKFNTFLGEEVIFDLNLLKTKINEQKLL